MLLLGEQRATDSRGISVNGGDLKLNWHVSEVERAAYTSGFNRFMSDFSEDIVAQKVIPADQWEFRTAAHHSGTLAEIRRRIGRDGVALFSNHGAFQRVCLRRIAAAGGGNCQQRADFGSALPTGLGGPDHAGHLGFRATHRHPNAIFANREFHRFYGNINPVGRQLKPAFTPYGILTALGSTKLKRFAS